MKIVQLRKIMGEVEDAGDNLRKAHRTLLNGAPHALEGNEAADREEATRFIEAAIRHLDVLGNELWKRDRAYILTVGDLEV